MDKAKFEKVMGVIGTITAVLMYVFYINTILNNLNGHALFKERRDWPVALANAPGIIFGLVAAVTAF